jgi:hypothetical protein
MMSQTLTLELPEEIYEAVMKAAAATGKPPAEWIATQLHQLLPSREPNLVEQSTQPAQPSKRSIMELHGLGAEIWQNIDAQSYVDELRNEWDRRR